MGLAKNSVKAMVLNSQKPHTGGPFVITRRQCITNSVPELLAGPRWVALVHTLGLSPREADVLRCVFSDERISAISSELGISQATVHTYRERLFRKLGVCSCSQLIALAFATYVELGHAAPRETSSARLTMRRVV